MLRGVVRQHECNCRLGARDQCQAPVLKHCICRYGRTRNRPLPAGRMEPSAALWFGTLISIVGAVYLADLSYVGAKIIPELTTSLRHLLYSIFYI